MQPVLNLSNMVCRLRRAPTSSVGIGLSRIGDRHRESPDGVIGPGSRTYCRRFRRSLATVPRSRIRAMFRQNPKF